MEATTDPMELLERVATADGRYALSAYSFLLESLRRTAETIHGTESEERNRHVTGEELSRGAARLAVERWGPLAGLILQRWGLRRSRDLGEMVFLLIAHGLLGKQDSDTIEDFDDVVDLAALGDDYRVCVEGPEVAG